jgi:hypothetical protein
MRGGVMEAHAARLLAEAPAAPETFEMFVYLERPEETAEVLRRLIQTKPAQMASPSSCCRAATCLRGSDRRICCRR